MHFRDSLNNQWKLVLVIACVFQPAVVFTRADEDEDFKRIFLVPVALTEFEKRLLARDK